mgnify:CR=1 FL=1
MNTIIEGGLRKPERIPVNLNNNSYWDDIDLDKELRRQFDVCHSCRRCFNLCDSFPKLFDLIDDSKSMELDTVESSSFSEVVEACTLCDMCFMVSCPYVPPHEFAIDIPSLFIRYKALENRSKSNFLDSQIANTDRNGKIGLLFPKLINFLTNKKNKLARKILSFLFKIDISATLPKFNKKSFKTLFKNFYHKIKHKNNYPDKVIIFISCYVNYNDSKIGEALLNVLNKNKIHIEEFYAGCCKMPQLEQGKIHEVQSEAIKTADLLYDKIKKGYKVIAPIASCALMIKSHWPLLNSNNKKILTLSENTYDIDEYLWDLNSRVGLVDGMKPLGRNITLHSSCHSRAQNIGPKSAQILKLIPGTSTVNVERCSGHGGTWGIKKKWNKTARKIGNGAARQIFKEENSIVASTCPLAALHLKDINEDKKIRSYDEKIYHPIELISKSYGYKG